MEMVTFAALKKGLVRQLIEQIVEFHPNMTEKQREESVQPCLNVIALFISLTVTFVGIVVWAFS
ncbi:hypothetical protein [Spirosoma pollinicola]|uniref:Uncharacterized protein n=1 Tax=Spirosoma pollinicola TaxID=2057025 RepID=A0A2K8YTA3_9BACT|nr:hypothetical protein [Spirosoma pollinicola]AUD00847.1 hypothetical protein CWM47_02865 [Spirosoma pollinicola]